MPSTKFASPPAPSDSKRTILPIDSSNVASKSTSNNMDLSRTTIYQVDYICVNAGRTVSATKRRIRWRFGFASAEAIDAGELGPQCRGEEHEIILNWSLTSGKRVILVDGNDVFRECKPYETTMEYAWEMRGGHVVKIRGSIAPKMWKDSNEKQFEMWMNGKKFSDFSQIYELGRVSTRSVPRKTLNTNTRKSRNRKLPVSEQVDWPKNNFDRNITPTTAGSEQSSFDFASTVETSPDPISPPNAAPAPTFDQILEANYAQPVEPTPNFFDAPVEPAPVPATNVDYEAQFRHNIMSQQVMQAYQNAPNVIAPVTSNPAADETFEDESIIQPQEGAVVPVFAGEETYIAPRLNYEEEEQDLDDVAGLMRKLCNLEDISSAPNPTGRLSIIGDSNLQKKKKKEEPNKSTPIAPPTIHSTGPQPSLNEIKVIRGTSSASSLTTNTQDVMKQPTFVPPHEASTGALVVHGSQSNHWNAHAAPPLHRPVGFGVGAQVGQGYGDYASTYQARASQQQGVYASM